MSNSHWANVMATLFEFSEEKQDEEKARREWIYRGVVADNREQTAEAAAIANEDSTLEYPSCQLCGHPRIRFSFDINNVENGNVLAVGCECIKKFIEVDDDGNIVNDPIGKGKKLQKDVRKILDAHRLARILNDIQELGTKDSTFDASSFINRLDRKGGFTLQQLKLLHARYSKNGIEYNVKDYKINLRSAKEKSRLYELEPWQFKKLRPVLSKTMQERYEKYHAGRSS